MLNPGTGRRSRWKFAKCEKARSGVRVEIAQRKSHWMQHSQLMLLFQTTPAHPTLFKATTRFLFLATKEKKKMNFMDPSSVLNLGNIRDGLIRMEDTIIFNLIERSSFYTMPSIYECNSSKIQIPDFDGSFLDWLFQQHEVTESKVRRYQSPDEYPFYPKVIEDSFLPPIKYPKLLAKYFREVNINDEIKDVYIEEMIPRVAKKEGDEDENYGSTATMDIFALQSISRRIHFGMFVAEAKFQADRELYTELIQKRDVEGLIANITNAAVEEKILERLLLKAKTYGTDPALGQHGVSKVEPEVVVGIYRDWVIPLTKKVEIQYLLRRLEDEF